MTDKPTYEELELRIEEIERKAFERKFSEEALQASAGFIDTLVSSVSNGVIVYDDKFRYKLWNKFMENLTGIRSENVLGKSAFDLFPHLREEGIDKLLERALGGEAVQSDDTPYHVPDTGKFGWVTGLYSPHVDLSGNIVGVVAVIHDISDRKRAEDMLRESEERHRLLLEVSPDPIVLYGIEGKTTYVNPAFEQTFGWTLDELREKRIDFVPEENWPETKEAIIRMLQGLKIQLFETRRLTKDGRILDIQLSSSLFFDREEKPVGNIVILRDITVQKRAERTLRKAHDELEQRVEERTAELVLINENLRQEIVDRRHAEEELQKSKAMFKAVVESLPFDVFALDPNNRYFLQNSICKKNWGDLIGKCPEDLPVNKETINLWMDNNRRALSGETITEEMEYDRLEGRKNFYYNIIAPIRDEEKIFGILGVLVDISELKQAEEALRESEKHNRRLVETMNDGIGIQDENGFITYVNNKFCQMLNYKPDDFIGKPVTNFLDDHNRQILKNQTAARKKGKVKPYEIEWTCKDGRKIQTIMSPQAIFNDNGQFKGSFSVITDISILKQVGDALWESKEQFRNLTEMTSDWIWEIDKNGFYTYVSPKIRDILGYEPEELIGKTPFDLMPPEEADRVFKIFDTISASQQPFDCLENINLHKNGHPVVLETSGIPTFDADGAFRGYRGIDRDITERKRTEELLRKQTHDLDERVKELNCLYGISKIRERPDIAFEEMLQEIVDLIPSSWQYPEIACARIIIEGQEYKTKNFKETVWKQTSNIVVHGKRIGILEICYLEERPERDEEPFLKEERSLISAITERLGRITEHKRAEGALRKAHDELEIRVAERTRELNIQKSNLEEANIALEVLLEKRQKDKKEIEDSALTNVKELIMPYFEKIKKTKLDDQQKTFLSIMESNLNEIISPFTRKMSLKYLNLTPTEIQVANLIRYGSDSKEIAILLGLSTRTIYNHRKNIRKKFGLENKKTNLRSHLLSIY